MLLNLKDVFLTEGKEKEFKFKLPMQEVEIDGFYPFKTDVDVFAKVINKASLITLTVDVKFILDEPCARCLEDTKKEFNYKFNHKLAESLVNENDDYIETENYHLKLDKLVIMDILLELPSKTLCSESCKGLCQKCGHNFNTGDCSCDKRVIDPRLEVLKQLIE